MFTNTKDRHATEAPEHVKSSTLVMDRDKRFYLPESKARSVVVPHEHDKNGECILDVGTLKYSEGIGFHYGRDEDTGKFLVPEHVPIKEVGNKVVPTGKKEAHRIIGKSKRPEVLETIEEQFLEYLEGEA